MNKLSLALISLLLCFIVNGQVSTKEIMNDISKAKSLIDTDPPEALELAKSCFTRSREIDFDKGVAESYIILGRCYIQTGDLESQKALNTALKYAEKINDKPLISDCYFYLGKSNFVNGDTKSQLTWYNKAFEIRKELNDQKRLADSYHAYGNVYLAIDQDSLAERYFNLSKEIRSMLHDMSGLAALCNNLGIIASNRGDTALYKSLMYQAIQMNEETGNKGYLAINHGNLGMIYREQGNYDSAWHHCIIAYDIRKANNFRDHLSGSYTDLGKIRFKQKRYSEALDYYKQGAELAESISGIAWLVGNYKAMAETYTEMDSLELSKKYNDLAEKIEKEHETDTGLVKKIPLPTTFDFKAPQEKSNLSLWIISAIILTSLVSYGIYRMKKK